MMNANNEPARDRNEQPLLSRKPKRPIHMRVIADTSPTTIKDVANLAGVSTATVSRVVNNLGVVSESTRDKVLHAIAKLQYRPNTYAVQLRSRRSCVGAEDHV